MLLDAGVQIKEMKTRDESFVTYHLLKAFQRIGLCSTRVEYYKRFRDEGNNFIVSVGYSS